MTNKCFERFLALFKSTPARIYVGANYKKSQLAIFFCNYLWFGSDVSFDAGGVNHPTILFKLLKNNFNSKRMDVHACHQFTSFHYAKLSREAGSSAIVVFLFL